jgi:hypothetical protein
MMPGSTSLALFLMIPIIVCLAAFGASVGWVPVPGFRHRRRSGIQP